MKCAGLAALLLAAGCSGTTTSTVKIDAAAYGAPQLMEICSGYGCIIKDKTIYGQAEYDELKTIMAPGAESAAAERAAISKAVAYMEKASRRKLRYQKDIAFSYQRNARKRGQMDCIDESLNTIVYLRYLDARGLLRHHKPISTYAERGLLVDGRYPHKSARMRARNGEDWAVDSWKKDNGGEPEIMPLKKWYKDRSNSLNYS